MKIIKDDFGVEDEFTPFFDTIGDIISKHGEMFKEFNSLEYVMKWLENEIEDVRLDELAIKHNVSKFALWEYLKGK